MGKSSTSLFVIPNRTFVRLAEHDIGTQSDGTHEDILISKTVKHGQYNEESKVNDIAMIYLERHVEFSGEIKNKSVS